LFTGPGDILDAMPRLTKADRLRLVKQLQAVRRELTAAGDEIAGLSARYSKSAAGCRQAAVMAGAAINLLINPEDVAGGIRRATRRAK
jgi:hypothetical protein